MTARDVSSRLLLGAVMFVVGCYDVPKPDCGFRCGPASSCPADYTCGADQRCRLNGAPADLVCAEPDAAVPPDAYSPTVIGSMPEAGGTHDPSAPVIVVFDRDVTGVDTQSFTVQPTNAPTPHAGTVTYDPSTRRATWTPTDPLAANTPHTLRLTAAIAAPGRPLMPTEIMFTTGEGPPTLVLASPANAATDVSVAANVRLRLSEPFTNLDATTYTLVEMATQTPVTGTVTTEAPTRTAVFDPQDQLTPNRGYQARLTGITDLGGNATVPNPIVVSFTTGADATVPAVRVLAPANLDTNVAVATNVSITFDEPVTPVTLAQFEVNGAAATGTVTMSNGNRTVTLDPASNLPAATTITVRVTNVVDTSSNTLAAAQVQFTTS